MITDEKKIKKVLQLLQDGYNKRDPKYLDTFMKIYSSKDSSLIIGTEQGGEFRGFESAKELFLGDWKDWGDVKYDINTPDIQVNGDMAWVFMFAELEMSLSAKDLNKIALKMIKNTLENERISENAKMVEILRIGALNSVEKLKGEIFNCPLRVTVIFTKENENWFINHMHFSHPVGLFNSFPRE
ncbi:MAG: nuclear transport factor 2 family protein [Promethearchaeota archaeon]